MAAKTCSPYLLEKFGGRPAGVKKKIKFPVITNY